MIVLGLVLINLLTVFSDENVTSGYFLPKTSTPIHYNLKLDVRLGPIFNYNGTVAIDIRVKEPTKYIVLHARELELDQNRSYILNSLGDYIKIISMKIVDTDLDYLVIQVGEKLQINNYKIVIAFKGDYYKQNKGLYLNDYSHGNDVRHFLATQLEPIYARNMFPCYDEPSLKATFQIEVRHPSTHFAVSNTRVERNITNGPLTDTVFKKTPIMSTYIIALGVTDFNIVESNYNNVSYRFYTQPKTSGNMQFALNITQETIKEYEKLLQINYTLPNLDGIIVPSFGGGMENWGLIVYGNMIAIAPNNTNTHYAVELLCHEIGHQWFGNLVTLKWWDYVWLNEAFATHYSYVIADKVIKNDRFMDQHVINLQDRLYADSFKSAQSLNRPVLKPEEYMSKFDSTSYQTGSAIVRFMSTYFYNFDYGISHYLQVNQFNNTEPTNLFNALNKYAWLPTGATVEKIMNSWTNKPGYPLITVNLNRTGSYATVFIKQERFSLDTNITNDDKWWIPITFTAQDGPDFEQFEPLGWLRDQDEEIILEVSDLTGWLIVNLQQTVYCRVNYDIDNWKRIISYLKGPHFEKIHPLNRAQLIDDSRHLATAGKLSYDISLELLEYIVHETDPLVRSVAAKNILAYSRLLNGTESYLKFRDFVIRLLGTELSNEILGTKDIIGLARSAIDTMDVKPTNYLPEFNKIADRIYTDEDYQAVKMATQNSRSRSNIKNSNKFLKKIKERLHINKAHKEEFLRNDYEAVKMWLNTKF